MSSPSECHLTRRRGNRILGGAESTNIWKTADRNRRHFGGFHSDTKGCSMAEPTQPNDGESSVIVSLSDAAMHMYSNAIQSLPDPADQEYPGQVGVILAGPRKLESALSDAARRRRATPAVIVALSSVRNRYDDLMSTDAWPAALRSTRARQADQKRGRQRDRHASRPDRGHRGRGNAHRRRGRPGQGVDRRSRRVARVADEHR